MKVDILHLQDLFSKPRRYKIPPFQRPYVWDEEEQWSHLWEDVLATAERCLDGNGPGRVSSHFLGAIVLQQESTPTSMLDTRLVVDGQQRLTTVQILLNAVREALQKLGVDSAAKRLELLVFNPAPFRGENPNDAFKVWPTMADQKAFRHAMSHVESNQGQYEKEPIVRAQRFFTSQVFEWLGDSPDDDGARVQALERAVTLLLELVVIDLELEDDPHIIFETLNARGTPLLQSDLIKNMVLYEAEVTSKVNTSQAVACLWECSDGWGRKEIRQGRLLRPRIDIFLNHWLVMRKHAEIAASDVFSEFRHYYKTESKTIEEVAKDINSVSKTYRILEESGMPEWDTFLYRWKVMQIGVLTPILLWLFTSGVNTQQIRRGVRALESYLVRRMVCRMSSQDYNRLMVRLIERLEEKGPSKAGDVIVDFLQSQTAYARHWPKDRDLKVAFLEKPLFRLLTRARLRMVLEGIEEQLRTTRAESPHVPRRLTIEHILPRKWRQNWRLPTDAEDDVRAAEERDYVKHTIGNLTLVNERLNPALSNAAWNKKRVILDDHTTLFLNKKLLKCAPDVWDEASIKGRSKRLYEIATLVWPFADHL